MANSRAAVLSALFVLLGLLGACARVPAGPDAATSQDGGANLDAGESEGTCSVLLELRPSTSATTVAVLGEWGGLDRSDAVAMQSDGKGGYSATFSLAPGSYAYVFLVNGAEQLDPANGDVQTVNGRPYSKLTVGDCLAPSLRVLSIENTRPGAGRGLFRAELEVTAPQKDNLALSVGGTLRASSEPFAQRALANAELFLSADGTRATVLLSLLADGKYTVKLHAALGARKSRDLLLPFWIEAERFSFRDSPIYMAVTDRFRDGDPQSNAPRIPDVPPSGDHQGGDLRGVELAIDEGYFDRLGVRALWLTPWQTQPQGAFLAQDGLHKVSGYHGYWPVKAREVDPRLGGAEALHRLVEAAHRHGIRVIMDAVLNHVHQEHEYFQSAAKKSWFRTTCTCGTNGCGWDERRLDCQFTDYLVDVDWTVPEAADQFVSDVLFWVETFDLDGLRVDAVKHLEDAAITSLASRMRERFEQAGTKYFMFGETFTGDYELVSHYIGPTALDAQLDFPLFMQVPESVFARDDQGLLHAKYWTEQSQVRFHGAPMVTFVGNHDVARFITKADPANRDRAASKWDNLPGAPVGQESYDRLYLALFHLLTTPGVPLLYYGDEYGEFGGDDPDNRHLMSSDAALWPQQAAVLAKVQKLAVARQTLRGLRRGPMQTLWCNSEDFGKGNLWAYARIDDDPKQSAVMVLNRTAGTWANVFVAFPEQLSWATGTVVDLLTGQEWVVQNGAVTLDVPGRGGVVLGLR